ncbi:MAG TPA: hypothetical protein VFA20_16520 [Myxococcaceae bacterium]|nr:hypothetical protein [Myxococcaceae bacterium]
MGHPQPGDVLLVRTPRKSWAVGRKVMGSAWDHVSLVIRGDCALNIVFPRAVRTPLSRMLRPERLPLLLRPAWPSAEARDGFVDALEALADVPYDSARGASFILKLALRRALGVRLPLRPPSAKGPRYVCTDTAVLGLSAALPGFEEALRTLPLDYRALRCASTTDFVRIAEARPDLLRREAL